MPLRIAVPGLAFLTAACLLPTSYVAAEGDDAKLTNILFIIADDVGWNDVSLHSSPAQIPTPNIDALARDGLVLDRYYTQPVCSPTRSSIMTGRHVIHTGIYNAFGSGGNKRLSKAYPLLPEYLQKVGYKTHLVGKWHLGHNEVAYLPSSRGFDSAYGYWNGAEGYLNHTTADPAAYDFADGLDTVYDVNGTYSTYLLAEKARAILQQEVSEGSPFFLYLAFQNVHWPLEAPEEFVSRFQDIEDPQRRLVAAMLSILDEGIGNITDTLRDLGVYDETLIVFVSDNGGPTNHFEDTQSNNFPLRGGKHTLWEGGVRVPCIIRGPDVAGNRISSEKMHVTDWLPSLLSMATQGHWQSLLGPSDPPFLLGDGMDLWSFISGKNDTSPREEVLHELNPMESPYQALAQLRGPHQPDAMWDGQEDGTPYHGNALTVGEWKLVFVEQNAEPGWYPPPGQDPATTHYSVDCGPSPPVDPSQCEARYCLFNTKVDPCEHQDLSSKHPDIVKSLRERLDEYAKDAVLAVDDEGCAPIVNERGAWRPCDAP